MKYLLPTVIAVISLVAGCTSTVSRLELVTVDHGDGKYSAYYVNKEETLPTSTASDGAEPAFSWALLSDGFQLFPVNTLDRYVGRRDLRIERIIHNSAVSSQQIRCADDRSILPRPVFQISSASLSPSRKQVVFSSRVNPGAPWTIWVIGAEGAGPRLLTFGRDPVWIDDETILYASRKDGRWSLVRSSVNGGVERVLVSGAGNYLQPQLSPDGRRLAYVSRPSSAMQSQIWMCASDGSARRQLTDYPGLDDSPVWGNDGKYLYFRSTRGGGWGAWKIAVD